MRILVIEDEVDVALLLADAVRLAGHETWIAHDGTEGLDAIDRERPDAVFLDVVMPGMSGIEVLRRIRADDSGLPVVLLTGHARASDLEEAQRLGVADIIEKPNILTNLRNAFAAIRTPKNDGERTSRAASASRHRPRGRASSGRPPGAGGPPPSSP
jgi:CheY-like chemotaxis protein